MDNYIYGWEFDNFDPIEGDLPKDTPSYINVIAERARIILRKRTSDEVRDAAEFLNHAIELDYKEITNHYQKASKHSEGDETEGTENGHSRNTKSARLAENYLIANNLINEDALNVLILKDYLNEFEIKISSATKNSSFRSYEYFAVASLINYAKYQNYKFLAQHLTSNEQDANDLHDWALDSAFNAMDLVSYAEQDKEKSTRILAEQSNTEKKIKLIFSDRAREGGKARQKKFQQAKAYALELYKKKNTWKSARDASVKLKDEVWEYQKSIQANMAESNIQNQVYKWILESTKK
jgi:hypothetical protein